MSDLDEILNAGLDEDERVAQAVQTAARDTRYPWPPEQAPGRGGPALTAFLKRFSEHRMLREVAAKRALIGEQTSDHAPIESIYGLTCRTCVTWQDPPLADGGETEFGIAIPEAWPCKVGRHLAAIYSGPG